MSIVYSVFTFLAVFICAVIKGEGIGYATHTFEGVGVDITVQINADNTSIDMCGASNVWYGVGFGGGLMMDVEDAIIVTNDGTTPSVQEYTLGDHALGAEKTTTQYTLTEYSLSADKLCVTIERDTVLNTAEYYDLPNTFSSPPHHDIIVAKGVSKSSTDASGHGSAHAYTTLTYTEGVAPTAAPTLSPTAKTPNPTHSPQVTIKSNSVDSKSSICFASDAYVLTYPDFKKTPVKELQIYDKMLTYDDVKDTFFWDELLVKIHFDEGEFLNDVLIPMREFILSNGEILTMSDNHLLFVGESGLQRADHVKLGDKLKVFDGSYADVIGIRENVKRYGRNLITYNGNLVINGIAISTFTESIWGESPSWGKWLRTVMKYGYSYDIWRLPAYLTAKAWTEYTSVGFKDAVLRFYFDDETEMENKSSRKANWFSSLFNSS